MNKEGAGLRESKNVRMILWNERARTLSRSSNSHLHLVRCHLEKTRCKGDRTKHEEYERLAIESVRVRQQRVRVTAVVVSSVGAINRQSLKGFEKVRRCSDRELRRLGR
jgi:hypothetical protein